MRHVVERSDQALLVAPDAQVERGAHRPHDEGGDGHCKPSFSGEEICA
jgi:hypothetical protein